MITFNAVLTAKGDALEALRRVESFSEGKFLRSIAESNIESQVLNLQEKRRYGDSLKRNLLESYARAWGGSAKTIGDATINPRTVVANNVYRVIKKIFLHNSFQGILTGSTSKAITTWLEGNILYGGISGGSWPSNGTVVIRRAAEDVIRELDKIYEGKSTESLMDRLFGHSISQSMSAAKALQNMKVKKEGFAQEDARRGTVTLRWDSSGVKITWPNRVKKATGLEDMEFPAESFETKKYNHNRQQRFFEFQEWFGQFVEDILHGTIDGLWLGTAKESGRGGLTSVVGDQHTTLVDQFETTTESVFGIRDFSDDFPRDFAEKMQREQKIFGAGHTNVQSTTTITGAGLSEEDELAALIRESKKDYEAEFGHRKRAKDVELPVRGAVEEVVFEAAEDVEVQVRKVYSQAEREAARKQFEALGSTFRMTSAERKKFYKDINFSGDY